MYTKLIQVTLFSLIYFGLSSLTVYASSSVGTIDPSFKFTKICQDSTCTDFGNVNFKPTINSMTPGALPVTITDTSITGHLWGDEIGWINLAPVGAGLSVNPTTGVVSGKAFANSGSWINFSPTGTGVSLVDNGSGSNFYGYAWVSGPNGGWMKFDCLSGALCVKTDWRAVPFRGGSGGGSGGGVVIPPTVTDACPNITGVQVNVPEGYVLDLSGRCIQTADVCPNITGIQIEIPNGYRFFKDGCEKLPDDFDYCPNIPGLQTSFASCPSENIQPGNTNQGGYSKPNKGSSNNFSNSIKNKFDTNNDGEPDFFPSPEVAELLEEGVFKQVFPKKEVSYKNLSSCVFCLQIRRDIFFDSIKKQAIERKILKWAFVPERAEIPTLIAASTHIRTDTEKQIPVEKTLDLTSAVISGFGLLALRRFVFGIIRKTLAK